MLKSWRTTLAVVLTTLATALVVSNLSIAKKPPPDDGGPRVICFTSRNNKGDIEVSTIDENGGNEFKVISGPDIEYAKARWSPDGLRLGGYEKWVGDGPNDFALMSIAADGTDEREIVTYQQVDDLNVGSGKVSVDESALSGSLSGVAWSPDGNGVVFSASAFYLLSGDQVFRTSHLYLADLVKKQAGEEGWLAQLGSDFTLEDPTDGNINFASNGDRMPHWSPSLNKIVFVSDREALNGTVGPEELWVTNPDGTGLREIIQFAYSTFPSWPMWSHGGDADALTASIAVTWDAYTGQNRGDIWILDVELSRTGDPVTATRYIREDPEITESSPAWSPSDDRLLFGRMVPGKPRSTIYQLVVVDLADGSETVILEKASRETSWSAGPALPHWNPVEPSP